LLACNRRDRARVQTDEESPALASVIHAADPRASHQMLKGWHDVEQNSWRWTQSKFSVLLHPPRDAARDGAVLQLQFSLPQVSISKLKTISLSAAVAGKPLSPETYTLAGDYTYSRDVPPDLLTGDAVTVEFTLDKALPPNPSDQRELGLIVQMVGLEPK
jgi:hypothetical protein